jgi:hypothetical protein
LPVERGEQDRALDFEIQGLEIHGLAIDGLTRQPILKLSQPGFLRQTGSPALVGAGSARREGRVVFLSGHDAKLHQRSAIVPQSADSLRAIATIIAECFRAGTLLDCTP